MSRRKPDLPEGPSWRWTVTETSTALQANVVSAAELTAETLNRIERIDPAIGAFVAVCADRAIVASTEATERRARGLKRSPLDGIPIVVKDLFHVPGTATTMGNEQLQRFFPATASLLVQRLEAAGCVIVGKTNTCELAHKATTDNRFVGPTSTPFAPGFLNAGGSSGGSAAAVGAMMVPAALGSDGAGSIRLPAAFCGVVGMKPTFGRVPNNPRPDGFRSASLFASGGPICRSTADIALLLDVLCGPHPADPFSLDPPPAPFAHTFRQPVDGVRVGVCPNFGGFPVEPDVVAGVLAAAVALESAGCSVRPSELSWSVPHGELCRLVRRAIGDGLDDAVTGLARQGLLPADPLMALESTTAALIEEARATGPAVRQRQAHVRTEVLDEATRAFGKADVLVGPVSCVRSVPNDDLGSTVGPSTVGDEPVDPLVGWCATWPWNLTGHPAVTVPVNLVEGTPVAVQIVGHRLADAQVLAVATALADALPWRHRYDALTLEVATPCLK